LRLQTPDPVAGFKGGGATSKGKERREEKGEGEWKEWGKERGST